MGITNADSNYIIGGLLTVLGFLIRWLFNRSVERFDNLESRIETSEKDIIAIKAALGIETVN